MLIDNFNGAMSAPVRRITARVDRYTVTDGILDYTDSYFYDDRLISIQVERVGDESKFFGFGICQKVNIKLMDVNRELDITTADSFNVYFSLDNREFTTPFPTFYVSEVHRDETTNQLSITAYDLLAKAVNYTITDLQDVMTTTSYSIARFTRWCASKLGILYTKTEQPEFNLEYAEGANFNGNELVRKALDDVAGATQTIYYLDSTDTLVFKRLAPTDTAVLTINKSDYFDLDSKTNRRLTAVCHATELGDNVEAKLDVSGTTQYVRDNAFWELRDDIYTLVDNALDVVGGLTINQFDCNWRGNFLLEIGDRINLVTKDNEVVSSYILNDTTEYNGVFKQRTQWNYSGDDAETASNPTSLGEVLNQTYARVDKINKEITLTANKVDENSANIATLQVNTEAIDASVKSVEKNLEDFSEGVNEDISTLTKEVSAKMTAEDVQIQIKSELDNGVSKVVTSTGFTFDEEGLSISKSDSDITTVVSEDGMTVLRNGTTVLKAYNEGVIAEDLHATTYLIIGTNSRFEDWGNRTACFWIGQTRG